MGTIIDIQTLSISDRGRKAAEGKTFADDDRIDSLETQLKEAKYIAEDADRKYDEVNGLQQHHQQQKKHGSLHEIPSCYWALLSVLSAIKVCPKYTFWKK